MATGREGGIQDDERAGGRRDADVFRLNDEGRRGQEGRRGFSPKVTIRKMPAIFVFFNKRIKYPWEILLSDLVDV